MPPFDLVCAFCTQPIETADWVFVNWHAIKCTHVGHKMCHEMAHFDRENDSDDWVPEKCPAVGCTAFLDDLRPAWGTMFVDQWGAKT